ncbi:adhesive plaque matrix protein 2-like [Portunus trituberculatus]|uniref:adhesive plaque matrix protein 2-like n=1 Tax=Portunus trituberculatus TaxID=210409 RepID=UPI001E1CD47A|nr:adhesive plaque matrix protein 2-like [Portunus trituberculatus]
MRLLALVLAVWVGGSAGQTNYYPSAPLRPIAPFGFPSQERIVSQGRITTGGGSVALPPSTSFSSSSSSSFASSFSSSSKNPCHPSPCGENTRCEVSKKNVALCRCIDGYVPMGNTINGCRPQCERDDECPDDYRCQGRKCVRVCVTGACAHNAECRARNHRAICECPANYRGNGEISCLPEEHVEERAPPAPPLNPCYDEPCGFNADCRNDNGRPVCSCPFGYEGDPLTRCTKGECIEHDDCPHYQVCQGLKCVNPCTSGMCGVNADCRVKDHQPVCSCPDGYVGDALSHCRRFHSDELCNPSPCGAHTNCKVRNERPVCSCITNYIGNPLTGCRPECVSDSECPHNMACRNNICVNPCRDACGENAYCDVRNQRAVCRCPENYLGDPNSRCYTECTEHNHCNSNQACKDYRCIDPCVGTCGDGANCKTTNNQPVCSCPRSHTGDPFKHCRPFGPEDYCNPNPCGLNANCNPGTDRSGDTRAVCTCPKYYVGNPLIECKQGECQTNDDCRSNTACYNYMCRTPCYTLDGDSVCGEKAECNVKNHMPVCSCPSGYSGNPLEYCFIPDYDDRRRTSSSFVLGRSY